MTFSRKLLVFDMDGTIADLYSYPNWLSYLLKGDAEPYAKCNPLVNMNDLKDYLETLQEYGWEVCVVTWLARGSSLEYKQKVRAAKKYWLSEHDFPLDTFHGIAYGSTKASALKGVPKENSIAILFDDDARVRKGWRLGPAVDPAENDLINVLSSLIEYELTNS